MKRMLWIVLMMSCGATYISSLFPLYGKYYQLSSLEITILFAVYAVILLPTLLIVGAKGTLGVKKGASHKYMDIHCIDAALYSEP